MADPFTLQLHITDACQLRCRHCYRDEHRGALPLNEFGRIIDEFTAFCRRRRIPGRLTFAGGEPLLRLENLLELMRQSRDAGHQIHLLTNGLLLTPTIIAQLKEAGCLRVQISIDGDERAHDSLRGQGAFAAAARALEELMCAGMPSTVSMTLGRWNLHCLDDVIALARRCGAKLFVSRFVPCGAGLQLGADTLNRHEWMRVMRQCCGDTKRLAGGVALRDPLYIPMLECRSPSDELCVGGCAIGYAGLAVDADGEAYPCRRLPISLGNLRAMSLEKIWVSPILEELRDRDRLKGRCGRCRWRWKCGGCRAIARGIVGDHLAEDPQCPWSGTWLDRFPSVLRLVAFRVGAASGGSRQCSHLVAAR